MITTNNVPQPTMTKESLFETLKMLQDLPRPKRMRYMCSEFAIVGKPVNIPTTSFDMIIIHGDDLSSFMKKMEQSGEYPFAHMIFREATEQEWREWGVELSREMGGRWNDGIYAGIDYAEN